MTIEKNSTFDTIFLSYGEPNAEKHWSSLLEQCGWAKRVDGVEGFDAAHKAAAALSETDWFITVDADNIVLPNLFDLEIDLRETVGCYSWRGLNMINGLVYGNGGVKLWRKSFVEDMRAHETASDEQAAVDFCWLPGYEQQHGCYSQVWVNGSPFQAFRAGYREGVKLALNRGQRVLPIDIQRLAHPKNLMALKTWCTIGAHAEHGDAAIMGARLGLTRLFDSTFSHDVINRYAWIEKEWEAYSSDIDGNTIALGEQIRDIAGIDLPDLDKRASKFVFDMVTANKH